MIDLICPDCKKICRSPHFKTCNSQKLSKKEFKFLTITNTYKNLGLPSDSIIREMYCEKETSIPEFRALGYSWGFIKFLLDYFSIPSRSHHDAMTSKKVRNKIESAFVEKYGVKNPLYTGTSAFEKKNATVKEKYNVDNVRQLQFVKDKITETHLQKYGKKRCHNGELQSLTKGKWTDEQKYEIWQKSVLTRSQRTYSGYSTSRMNQLESRVAAALTTIGIPFNFSFYFKNFQFDFKIGNILIEVQGDFWHANPEFYLANQKLSHPGKIMIAKDIWAKDKKKVLTARTAGYNIFEIWENDISNLSDNELVDFILIILAGEHHHLL